MNLIRFLLSWPNAPFTIVGGIAVVFALLQMSGALALLGGDHEGDHDVDVDHDVDAGGGHDAEGGHDADNEHDADQDHDQDADSHGFGDLLVGPLGLGKIPFSVIWQTYAVIFAATGLALNARFLMAPSGPPLVSLAWTIPSSLVGGWLMVALVARFFGPVLATKEQEATTRAQLVGQEGVVISSRVTADFGEIRIRDRSGHDLRVIVRLAEGSKSPVEQQRVVVVDYESERGLLVAPLDSPGGEDAHDRKHAS